MTPVYTLSQLAEPMNPISSTLSITVSIMGEQSNSFSMPPFLYYAMKAKALARLGIKNELTAEQKGVTDLQRVVLAEMREIAKSVHRDITSMNIDMENYVSTAIQSRLLFGILGEKEKNKEAIDRTPSIPINASTAKKNVTLPAYLFKRINAITGGDKFTRSQIHYMVSDIKSVLEKNGGLDANGKLQGPAANSSWSRKLHNQLFLWLIKLSGIKELSTKPSILEVKMKREPKIETRVRNGTLSV